MKRILAFFLAVVLICSLVPVGLAAEASGRAYPSTQKVDVDGKRVEFQCYALKDAAGNDTNYIKLRDLAEILNGSAAQFEVGWNGAVNIETGKAYTKNGSEMSTPFSGERMYETAAAPTNINGAAADLDAIVLKDEGGNGYTYYKLRDLGKALGITVDWSAEKGIFIETKEKEVPNVTVFSKDSDKTLSVPVTSVKEYINKGWSTLPREVTIDESYFQTYGKDSFVAEEKGEAGGWTYGDGCLMLDGNWELDLSDINWNNQSRITQIYISRGVDLGVSYGKGLFSGHTSLRRVELPNTMKSLNSEVFKDCPLTRVGIPSSVTYISSRAFGDYTTEYIEEEGKPSWSWEEVYRLKNRNLVIYCEPGSKASEFADEYNVQQVAATQVFYPDGRTCMVTAREKKDYLKKGWCEEPVTLMYNADGEVKAVPLDEVSHQNRWYESTNDFRVLYNDEGIAKVVGKNETEGWHELKDIEATIYDGSGNSLKVLKSAAEIYLNSGWYANEAEAKVMMYAPDGRAKMVWKNDVEANEKVGWYRNSEDVYVTLYALDGRTTKVFKSKVEEYEKVGWHSKREDVYVTMWAGDGRTKEVPKGKVEENQKVGWYASEDEAKVTLYALDGRTKTVWRNEAEANEKVGWFQDKSKVYTTMYALDGRSKDVLNNQVAENQKVGWYTFPDYLCAKADEKVGTDGYDEAVTFMEASMLLCYGQDYYNQLVQKRNSLCDAWRKKIKCPIAILGHSISHNSIGTPEVTIAYRNLTGLTINAFEDQFTCVDAYGNVTTDYGSFYNGTIKSHADNANIGPYGTWSGTVTLYSNERTTSIKNLYIVRAAFSDGTIWKK